MMVIRMVAQMVVREVFKKYAKTYGILHLWGQPTHEKFHILFAFTSMLKYATNIYSV